MELTNAKIERTEIRCLTEEYDKDLVKRLPTRHVLGWVKNGQVCIHIYPPLNPAEKRKLLS